MNDFKNRTLRKIKFILPVLTIFTILFFTDCNKGKVEILNIIDTVENCSAPYIVSFYAEAEYNNGDLEFTWDFGDGSSSHEIYPVHVYEKTGNYSVNLSIKNKDAEDKMNKSIDLTEEAISINTDWDYELLTEHAWAPARIQFTNFSEHATSYFWDFGDGITSDEKSPIHIFETAGNYNVRLDGQCSGSSFPYFKDIMILPPPADVRLIEIEINLPSSYIGANIYCEAFLNYDLGYIQQAETETAISVKSFPIVLPFIYGGLDDFHGNYGRQMLTFEVWEEGDNRPISTFEIPMSAIQNDFYPDVISWDRPGGAINVTLKYD